MNHNKHSAWNIHHDTVFK